MAALIPYENYIGAILGGQFRLGPLLEQCGDADLYSVEALRMPGVKFYAKTYALRGLSRPQLDFKKKSMKRLQGRTVCTIDQGGRKFIVCRSEDVAGSSQTQDAETSVMVASGRAKNRVSMPEVNSNTPMPEVKFKTPIPRSRCEEKEELNHQAYPAVQPGDLSIGRPLVVCAPSTVNHMKVSHVPETPPSTPHIVRDSHGNGAESPGPAESPQRVEGDSNAKRRRKNKRRGIRNLRVPSFCVSDSSDLVEALRSLSEHILYQERELDFQASCIERLEASSNSSREQQVLKALYKRRPVLIKRLARTKSQLSILTFPLPITNIAPANHGSLKSKEERIAN